MLPVPLVRSLVIFVVKLVLDYDIHNPLGSRSISTLEEGLNQLECLVAAGDCLEVVLLEQRANLVHIRRVMAKDALNEDGDHVWSEIGTKTTFAHVLLQCSNNIVRAVGETVEGVKHLAVCLEIGFEASLLDVAKDRLDGPDLFFGAGIVHAANNRF
ncbi:hypothetical protein HG531_007357 [Fusarium graminearum]|nr:hypothetical protein HG531_007357 [Fusarium graminearum]